MRTRAAHGAYIDKICDNADCVNPAYCKHLCKKCYDRKRHTDNRDRLLVEMRIYNKKMYRPKTFDEWVFYLCRRISLNSSARRSAETKISREEIRRLLFSAISSGDVSLADPIEAPSPDRIRNELGYVSGNVRIIPRWLNLARNTSSIDAVESAIIKWARRRDRLVA